MRSDLNKGSLDQSYISNDNFTAFLQEELVHHLSYIILGYKLPILVGSKPPHLLKTQALHNGFSYPLMDLISKRALGKRY